SRPDPLRMPRPARRRPALKPASDASNPPAASPSPGGRGRIIAPRQRLITNNRNIAASNGFLVIPGCNADALRDGSDGIPLDQPDPTPTPEF
ncbi:MAG TPA: hypothetical protein PKU91_05530, partial [Phycisphaerales bacterium]|nr:hypothetical protein [Phycisphaerales bacterium]